MDRVFKGLRWRAWLVAAATFLLLAGCGGGGGGGASGGVGGGDGGGVQILDSFGQAVAAGGGDGVGVGDAGGDGTAGDGAPIVGGVVVLTDANGKSVSATTDAQGYYRVKLTGFTPPFVAKVTKPNGQVRHSLSVKTPQVNGFITINLSGLTDKVASDVARAAGKSGAAELTPQIVASNTAVIAQSLGTMRSSLQAVISAAGIDPNNFDPLGTPFRPDHTGYDFVLDNVVVAVAADGSTQVSMSPSFAPPLAGNWRLYATAEGITADTGIVVAGKDVPTLQTASQMTVADFSGAVVALEGVGAGYTVSVSGNTTTITGPATNYTINIASFSVSNYQSCGTCGVGSEISLVVSASGTEGGLMDGFQEPVTSFSGSVALKWVRVN